MSVPAGPFAGRLLGEIARYEGGLPAACAAIGITPQDVDAIASGRTASVTALAAIYGWLDARAPLGPEEKDDYERLKADAARNTLSVASGGPPAYGQSSPQPPPRQPHGRTRLVGVAAVAVVTIVIIVVITVVLTITIIHPGNGQTAADSSPSPTPTPKPPSASASAAQVVGTPTSSSTATQSPFPAPSSSGTGDSAVAGSPGNLIATYDNYKLPCNDGIAIGPGGPPLPQSSLGGDLSTDCTGSWYGGTNDELALVTGHPTYAYCARDTVIGGQLSSVTQGDVICVQGSGIIAVVSLVGSGDTGGINYVTLDVRVWRDLDTTGGG